MKARLGAAGGGTITWVAGAPTGPGAFTGLEGAGGDPAAAPGIGPAAIEAAGTGASGIGAPTTSATARRAARLMGLMIKTVGEAGRTGA